MSLRVLIFLFFLLNYAGASAQTFITIDAERFAKIYNENSGSPSKDIIDQEYLKPGTDGIKIFTPRRIKNALNMESMIKRYPRTYDKGVKLMLPAALESSEEAGRVLAEVQELLDQNESAPVYILFGGNNSGGTASRKGLAIGLEVLGRFVETQEEAKELITSFIAHEVVHVYQSRSGNKGRGNLLYQSLREGFADYIENTVTGKISRAEVERHEYGMANEVQLWSEFKEVMDKRDLSPWMYGEGKDGRPADLGYWIGKRICKSYYDKANDKAKALKILLELKNPENILINSGYNPVN